MQLPQQSSHWYKHEDGLWKPCFEVPKASGKGMKKPNRDDAQALGLAPSVTTILGVINKPDLNNYIRRQTIMAALTLPRIPGEDEGSFAKRVIEDSEQHGLAARELGTRIHKCIEEQLTDPERYIVPIDLRPFIAPFYAWCMENIIEIYSTEKIVGDMALGYAGMLDLHCKLKDVGDAVVDFKTQSVKNDKPVFYPEYVAQLAAYAAALKKDVSLVSVVIDSKTPRAPFVHVYPKDRKGYYLFLSAFDWWKHINKWNSAQEPEQLSL